MAKPDLANDKYRTIPKKYVTEVCRIGKESDACRYLIAGPFGFDCAKLSIHGNLLDKRARDKEMTARADNCEGWSKIDKSFWILK